MAQAAGGSERPTLKPSGRLWCWWRGDPLPPLGPLPGLTVTVADADAALAELNALPLAEVVARARGWHRPYVARLDGRPVGYGWVATRKGSFWEDRVRFPVPPGSRYLWDFATLSDWRGRGIYPRLLQAILTAEQADAERFWILHEWGNVASERGIARAGFQLAATLYHVPGRRLGVAPEGSGERGRLGATFLRLPLLPADTTV